MISQGPTLLHIYDADDYMINFTAGTRSFSVPGLAPGKNIHRVPVHGGRYGLVMALDQLVKEGRSYQRALFETHGSTGTIFFGNDKITADAFKSWTNRGYEKIFPYFHSRIYFNGCNVADDPKGWGFLDAAGKLFLRLFGGITFASTGPGRPILLTGHVHHFSSTTSYSTWAPNGTFLAHSTD